MEPIAVVGMSGRFPGAPTLREFWQNLSSGTESVSAFSESDLLAEGIDPRVMRQPNYVNARAVIERIEWFDAQFFGFSPRTACWLDPQHRIFLECVWEALETGKRRWANRR